VSSSSSRWHASGSLKVKRIWHRLCIEQLRIAQKMLESWLRARNPNAPGGWLTRQRVKKRKQLKNSLRYWLQALRKDTCGFFGRRRADGKTALKVSIQTTTDLRDYIERLLQLITRNKS